MAFRRGGRGRVCTAESRQAGPRRRPASERLGLRIQQQLRPGAGEFTSPDGETSAHQQVLPTRVGKNATETKGVSLENDGAQRLANLTFSDRLGRDRNSNDKTGIKVASSPYNPSSCK